MFERYLITEFEVQTVTQLNKIIVHLKNSNVNAIKFVFSNCKQNVFSCLIDNGTISIEIFCASARMFVESENINNIIGIKNYNINDYANMDNHICSEEHSIAIIFSCEDFVRFIKVLDVTSNNIILLNFINNTVKTSSENSFAFITCDLSERYYAVNDNIYGENNNNKIKYDFGNTFNLLQILCVSNIVCSNAYGRIINKATGFINIEGSNFCVSTNGRVLVNLELDENYKCTKEFNINITKNVAKFLTTSSNLQKVELIYNSNNNTVCFFSNNNYSITFSLIEQKNNIKSLVLHKFEKNIVINSYILDNTFNFFNKIKGMTTNTSISFSKEKNSNNVCGYVDSSSMCAGDKLGTLDEAYYEEQINILFSIDVFNLLKQILKKIAKSSNYDIVLFYNSDISSNFAKMTIVDSNIDIFFAIC